MSQPSNSENSQSILLDAMIDSVLRALRTGQSLDLEALAAQYPTIADEVRQLVPALVLAENLRCESQLRDDSWSPPDKTSLQAPAAGSSVLIGVPGQVNDDLLYGAMALQCELITPEQFLAAFELWHGDRRQSLKQILIEQHALLRETQRVLDELLTPINPNANDTAGATHVYTPGPNTTGKASDTALSSDFSSTRFQFLRPLDRGGLGVVSVALDKELNREVALKEIRDDRADDRVLQQKFLLEAEVTGGLEHPGIVPIYGLGKSTNGRPYYAMRLIKGSNLQSHIQAFHKQVESGEIPFDGQMLRRLLRRFIDICEAIDYAHSRGVLHRDLKPVNVMLGRYGETLVVDWGLAKALGVSTGAPANDELLFSDQAEKPLVPSGSHESETRDGSIIGTPAYAPPEQLAGNLGDLGIRSDVYGLGATLYELLCGQAPARGSLIEIRRQVTEGKIASTRVVNPRVPKSLDAVCRKAMSTLPQDRYASASQLRAEIERWLDDAPVQAMPEPVWSHCRRWVRKHPTLASTLSAIVFMSTLGVATFALMVARNNASLAKLNRELDSTNIELVQANEREREASALAQQQSALALSTLNAVVNDIQSGLKSLPGSSDARRRLAETVMPRLEKVALNASMQSAVNRSTLRSLMELSTIVLQLGTDAAPNLQGTTTPVRLTTKNSQSATKIALSTLERAHDIATRLVDQTPDAPQANLDYIDCCYDLSQIHTRLGKQEDAIRPLESALATCEKLLKADPASGEFLQKQTMIQFQLGDCIVRSKRVDDAIGLYEPAIATQRKLIDSHPLDINSLRLLSIGLQFLGDAYVIKAELLKAQQAFEEAVQLRQKVLETDGRPQYVRELSYAMGKVAYAQQLRGEIQPAIETTSQTIQRLQKSLTLDPQDTWMQSELASNMDSQAKLLMRVGETNKAIETLHSVVALREALCNRDSSDISWQRNLSVAYDSLGQVLLQQGDLGEALEPFTKSLDIARQLAESDPSNTTKQRDVALSLVRMGKLLLKQAQPEQALPIFEESLAMMKQLSEADPSNAVKQRDWIIGISYVADVYMAMKRPSEAMPLYQEGLRLARLASSARPQAIELKRDLGIWLALVIDVHLQLNAPQAAVEPAQEAVALNRSLTEIDDKDLRAKMDYATALRDSGSILGKIERSEEAERQLQESLGIMQELLASDPQNAETKVELATTHEKCGDLLLAGNQLTKAAAEYTESQKLFTELVEAKPLNILWRQSWVESSRRLADTLIQQEQKEDALKVRQSILAFLDEMITKDQATEWCKEQRASIQADTQTP